jgi:hypothetical protein
VPFLQRKCLALHHPLQLHLLPCIRHTPLHLPAALLLCKPLGSPGWAQLRQGPLQHGWHHSLWQGQDTQGRRQQGHLGSCGALAACVCGEYRACCSSAAFTGLIFVPRVLCP